MTDYSTQRENDLLNQISTPSEFNTSSCNTYKVEIFIAGDYNQAKLILQEWCLKGACVSIEKVDYIYTMGQESGMVVRIINYPRFPADKGAIKSEAIELGEHLIKKLHQGSCSVVADDETLFISRRAND